MVRLAARHPVAICTGSCPDLPELPGLAKVRPWTNREATDWHAVPGRLAIVGGGGVGVEMASAWQGLDAQALLTQADGLLPRMEAFAGDWSAMPWPRPTWTCASASPSPGCAARAG